MLTTNKEKFIEEKCQRCGELRSDSEKYISPCLNFEKSYTRHLFAKPMIKNNLEENIAEILKEFDEIAYPLVHSELISDEVALDRLKSFISQSLKQFAQEITESMLVEIEDMKEKDRHVMKVGQLIHNDIKVKFSRVKFFGRYATWKHNCLVNDLLKEIYES